ITDRKLFTAAGFRGTGAWLASVAPDADAGDPTLAGRLVALPHLRAALTGGVLSVTAGRKVAGALVKVRPHLDRTDGLIDGQPAEPVITAVVRNVLTLIAQHHCGLAETVPAQAALLAELEQAVALIQSSGTSELDRVEQAMVLLGTHLPARWLTGALEELVLQVLPSVRSKRLHDALQRLLSRYLDAGLGGISGKVPVQVSVTISADTITGAPGAPPARGASGQPLARSLLRRWWCDAHVTTLLM